VFSKAPRFSAATQTPLSATFFNRRLHLFPPSKPWVVVVQHFSGLMHEPFAGMLDQGISGLLIASPKPVYIVL
jgi:hypothetical protein